MIKSKTGCEQGFNEIRLSQVSDHAGYSQWLNLKQDVNRALVITVLMCSLECGTCPPLSSHVNLVTCKFFLKMNWGWLEIKCTVYNYTYPEFRREWAGSRRCSCSAPSWRRSCRSPGNLSRSPDWTRIWRRPPSAWTTTGKYTVIQASTHCVN